MTVADRIHALVASIPEPCALAMRRPTTIEQMGLIDEVRFADGRATITLCLTDPACVHFAAMKTFIADRLRAIPEVTSVEVIQTTTQLWTPDRMVAT